ncbi:MAG: cupin domain-containing protein [Clostridia bacterium]|jgi:transcriptional regulator with XRE-family HTH domain|nr:cupin domain-containing protein [Clostridiaceae bacterium]
MNIGKKIKRLRQLNNLTQQELADRSELSKGYISQLEKNIASPSIATLMDLLQCLGTDLKEFFSQDEDYQVVFTANDMFENENEENKSLVKWLVPNCKKYTMEPIIMILQPGGVSKKDEPHSGEEFGYVLDGTVDIHLGSTVHKARKGNSFYYDASLPHYISNSGKRPAKILWISSPPNF